MTERKKYKSIGHCQLGSALEMMLSLLLISLAALSTVSTAEVPRTNLLVTIITLAIVESITAIRIEVVVVIRVEVLIVVFQVQLLQRPRPTLNGVAVPGPLQVRHRHTSDRHK